VFITVFDNLNHLADGFIIYSSVVNSFGLDGRWVIAVGVGGRSWFLVGQ
jgi:hypothetical protein